MDFSKTVLGLPYQEDDRVLIIAKFISENLINADTEIELKIGKFKFYQGTPCFSHAVEIDLKKYEGRFESSLQPLMFTSLLETLKSLHKDFTYTETQDFMYNSQERDTKIRQTIGQNQEVLSVIRKSKIAEKNFLVDQSGLGLRISANYEEKILEIPEGAKMSVMRKKKRYAFRYQYLEIDLTEVGETREDDNEEEHNLIVQEEQKQDKLIINEN